jgi:hypothetical protein
MWRSKKFYLTSLLAVLLLMTLPLLGTSCSQTGSDTSGQTSPATTEAEEPDRVPPQMPPDGMQPPMAMENLDEVAGIIGVEPEVLQNAFAQAMSEVFENSQPPSGEGMPEGPPTEGTPPEMPDIQDGPPEMQGGMTSDELLARVAEILNIDQQELEDAFAQAQG